MGSPPLKVFKWLKKAYCPGTWKRGEKLPGEPQEEEYFMGDVPPLKRPCLRGGLQCRSHEEDVFENEC